MSNQSQPSARKRGLLVLKRLILVLFFLAILAMSVVLSACDAPNGIQNQCNGVNVTCTFNNGN